ncbi:dihydrofolate reductase [Actinomadura pelletieri DSM 43383]|uniref:Dihydrofolate reductase n=1 Tax=Actinomadura pelletieri DSM 43383 TaxID=1120940 RepID=A0A495QL31_9ACTN|nr:dihydrofolate reductase family protein [Actinomadura pelletieri]RKS73282.1 dihydrofolate reductase [Actinomadura pelletieri DSM 43383]
MPKLIVVNIISLDGFYEGPGKDVMALPFHEAFDEYNAARLRAADTLLLGRDTYEGFKTYWPPVADDPSAPAVEREISRLNNAIDKVVISDTLIPEQTAPWHNTEIVERAAAHTRITELKKTPGKGIVMFGSRTLWHDLLSAGLVDELHIMIGPSLLGGGTPLFSGPSPVRLRLLDSEPLPGRHLVLARYTPA